MGFGALSEVPEAGPGLVWIVYGERIMLKIYFGDMEEAIYNTSDYFDVVYEDAWITSTFAKAVIKDIDKSEVLSSHCIESPVLGQIPPVSLAGGTKTLLLMYFEPENIFNASTCGDNCAKWILEIAQIKDVTINLRHIMDFGREKPFGVEVMVLNSCQTVRDMSELLPQASRFLRENADEGCL